MHPENLEVERERERRLLDLEFGCNVTPAFLNTVHDGMVRSFLDITSKVLQYFFKSKREDDKSRIQEKNFIYIVFSSIFFEKHKNKI